MKYMKVILSLTSTFERSNLLFYGIQSILKQSFKPNLILVNLSKNSYLSDSGFSTLPEWLNKADLKINFVNNIGSYRKLIPALEYADKDDIIVTADDDILYDVNWLKNLVGGASSEPDSIVCCKARIMEKNIFDNWQNYSNWDLINERIKGFDILPIGAGGVVYRKRLLDLRFLKDHTFLEIAPTIDDLWFRMASLRMNTPIAVFPEIDQQNIYLRHEFGLEEENRYKAKRYNSIVLRVYNRWRLKVANYIGINQAKNDFAWDLICKYSQKDKPNV